MSKDASFKNAADPRIKRFPAIAALITFFAGLIGLMGWILRCPTLQNIFAPLPAMFPLTATLFLLASIALWILYFYPFSSPLTLLRRSFATLIFLSGALFLFEYLSGTILGIDRLLFPEALKPLPLSLSGRPSIFTSLNFLLFGIALGIAPGSSAFLRRSCEICVTITLQISLLALVGYVCDVPLFYGWVSVSAGTGMALQTLSTFVVLGCGYLAANQHFGLTRLLSSTTVGGLVVRRLILAPVAIPLTIGILERTSRWLGFYNEEVASWLFAFLNIFIFTAIIWWIARLLHRSDLRRLEGEHALQKLNLELEENVVKRTRELSLVLKQILESEEKIRLVLDSALDAVITIDEKGIITSWNPEAEKIFGWPKAGILGLTLTETIIPAKYREAHQRGMKHYAASGEGPVLNRRIEITALHKDGTEFPVELAITPLRMGDKVAFSAFLRDITARKKAETEIQTLNATLELKVMERTAQLEEANKELEAFSYSVSHDLRSPLRHIDGFVDLLRQDSGSNLSPESSRYLNLITKAARDMGKLISDLLDFSHTGRKEMNFNKVKTRDLVDEIIAELSPELQSRIVHWEIGPLPELQCDRSLMKQVWLNLLSNAVKYTVKVPVAEIQIQCRQDESGHWEFSIRDNGAGFDMRNADKLFGVFQRLHRSEDFEGTGIGLANAQRIILRHGGRIRALGKPGQGATFFFTLPPLKQDESKEIGSV